MTSAPTPASPSATATGAGPLAGIRILSLAEQYPGPYATMLLADLGADVILVERPGSGDPARRFPGLFAAFSRNKRSVALNLKSAAGKADFLRLVDSADVVMEGYRPGVMDRLGIGATALRARKPGLVFTSISAFGQTGPNVAVVGHDLSIQGAAGMIDIPVGQEAGYGRPVLPLADIASAMFAVIGVVTALFARAQQATTARRGAHVDVSMLDALVSWMAPFLVPPMNGLPVRPLPPPEPCYGLFGTADGRQLTLSIAGEDEMWDALCELLGLQHFKGLTEAQRVAQNAELEAPLRAAVARHDYAWLYRNFEACGIAFGPVAKPDEVVSDPQVMARGLEQVLPGAAGGATRFIRQPILFDGLGGRITRPVPALGEHNQELLGHP